jgi:hypothetical protein
MPRYKLRVPEAGTMLYGDGDTGMVADTIEQARDYFAEWDGGDERPIYLHSYIGVCRVAYKRDVEAGDCHEDAEPGDTTVDYCRDDGRALADHEVRVWMLGPPSWPWNMEYSPPEAVSWKTIPVGADVRHGVWGSGRVCAPPRLWRASRTPLIPVQFYVWESGWVPMGPRRDLPLGAIDLLPTGDWPGDTRRVTLTVAGEVVAEGVSAQDAHELHEARIAQLNAEWEAEQLALVEAEATR